MKITQDHVEGARQVIQRGLGLLPGQNLLIIADETTEDVAALLRDTAMSIGVSAMIVFIPQEQQMLIPQEYELSDRVQSAAQEARAIITCVNDSPDCLPFRYWVFHNYWKAHARLGHMPGASLPLLKLANVDYKKLVDSCHRLELAMARGRTIEFISFSKSGEKYFLQAEIGGWDRIPVASNGVIEDGIWGNVPSGETFIAPIEGTADGLVVINGSIPGRVIDMDEEFFVRFEQGRLVDIYPRDNQAVRMLFEKQFNVAKAKDDANWDKLAEIGIGVNPAFGTLTGSMLLDEKCAGTAHVALGTNTYMGGAVNATIHCDLVVKKPSIRIDGKPVLEAGELVLRPADWLDDFQQVDLERSLLREARQVCRSEGEIDVVKKQLVRILHSVPGRLIHYPIGSPETARLASRVYRCLPAGEVWVDIQQLTARTNMDAGTVRKLLHVMKEYAVIEHSD
jgi:leucyl aminopeptidase (aminopeptidase T)